MYVFYLQHYKETVLTENQCLGLAGPSTKNK